MVTTTMVTTEVRQVLKAHGRLAADVDQIGDADDLYRLGMTSHASVNVMLALEEAFDVEFPDRMLQKSTFSSITAIATALTELGAGSGR